MVGSMEGWKNCLAGLWWQPPFSMIRAHIEWHLWLLPGLTPLIHKGWNDLHLFWCRVPHFHSHSQQCHSCFRIFFFFLTIAGYKPPVCYLCRTLADNPLSPSASTLSFPLNNCSDWQRKQWMLYGVCCLHLPCPFKRQAMGIWLRFT